jgi:hypothetical protein
MRYWVFHEEMLAIALAARKAERMQQGVSEQQAKDETLVVVEFLASPAAAKMIGGDSK